MEPQSCELSSTLVQVQEGTRSEICIIITDESEREQTWLVAVNRIINHHRDWTSSIITVVVVVVRIIIE